jgi:hypothetical protein
VLKLLVQGVQVFELFGLFKIPVVTIMPDTNQEQFAELHFLLTGKDRRWSYINFVI